MTSCCVHLSGLRGDSYLAPLSMDCVYSNIPPVIQGNIIVLSRGTTSQVQRCTDRPGSKTPYRSIFPSRLRVPCAAYFPMLSLAAPRLFGVGFYYPSISIFSARRLTRAVELRAERIAMKAKLVGWIEKTQGSFGDTVFKEQDGETRIVRKPSNRKSEYSEQELAKLRLKPTSESKD
jgi:hypothetical protein